MPVREGRAPSPLMYTWLLVEMALRGLCPGLRRAAGRMASGGGNGEGPGGSLGQQRRFEGAIPRAVPRGQHLAGEVVQRVVGLCKATSPSAPAPPTGEGGLLTPRWTAEPPLLPRYLSVSVGWRSALSSPGPARCTACLEQGEEHQNEPGGIRERPPRRKERVKGKGNWRGMSLLGRGLNGAGGLEARGWLGCKNTMK